MIEGRRETTEYRGHLDHKGLQDCRDQLDLRVIQVNLVFRVSKVHQE